MEESKRAKESLILEVKKIMSILNSWGNVLVPGYDDKKQVTARKKLSYCVSKLSVDYNMDIDDIEKALAENF